MINQQWQISNDTLLFLEADSICPFYSISKIAFYNEDLNRPKFHFLSPEAWLERMKIQSATF